MIAVRARSSPTRGSRPSPTRRPAAAAGPLVPCTWCSVTAAPPGGHRAATVASTRRSPRSYGGIGMPPYTTRGSRRVGVKSNAALVRKMTRSALRTLSSSERDRVEAELATGVVERARAHQHVVEPVQRRVPSPTEATVERDVDPIPPAVLLVCGACSRSAPRPQSEGPSPLRRRTHRSATRRRSARRAKCSAITSARSAAWSEAGPKNSRSPT